LGYSAGSKHSAGFGSKASYGGRGIVKTSETTVVSRMGDDDEIQLVEFEQGKKTGTESSDGGSDTTRAAVHSNQGGFAR
jgi:hypothetical protein